MSYPYPKRKSSGVDKLVTAMILFVFVVVVGGLIIGGLKATAAVAGAGSWSDGGRTGTITKFSYTGTFKKSWEGELRDGTMRSTKDAKGNYSGMTESLWLFSVPDSPEYKPVVDALTKARRSGKRVDLEYTKVRIVGYQTETPYYITAVNFINDNGDVTDRVTKR